MFEEIGQVIEQGVLNSIQQTAKNSQAIKYRKKLIEIREELQQYYQVLKVNKGNKTRWKTILKDNVYDIDWVKIKNDEETEKKFITLITLAYEYTTKILAELGLIHSVKTVVTFIDDDYNYFKLDDIELNADYVFLDKKAESHGGDYSLRLNSSKLKELARQKQRSELDQIINAHFKNFIAPFVEYQAVAKTGWKPNKGVLGEAFERHLEQVQHNTLYDYLLLTDFGSVGDRWQLYKQSSGSDPYFTGPDTEFAQVKNMNASLVSNVATVLNTLDGIIAMTDEEANIIATKKQTKNLFKQAEVKEKIRQDVLLDLMDKAPEYVESIVKNLVARGKDTLLVSYYEGTDKKGKKITKTKTIKINKDNFSLQGLI